MRPSCRTRCSCWPTLPDGDKSAIRLPSTCLDYFKAARKRNDAPEEENKTNNAAQFKGRLLIASSRDGEAKTGERLTLAVIELFKSEWKCLVSAHFSLSLARRANEPPGKLCAFPLRWATEKDLGRGRR